MRFLLYWGVALALLSGFSAPMCLSANAADGAVDIKCNSRIIDRKSFDDNYKSGVVDVNKLLAITPINTEAWDFSFNGSAQFFAKYEVKKGDNIVQSAVLRYPDNNASSSSPNEALKLFSEFVGRFNSVGLLQFNSFFFGQELDGLVAQCTRLGESGGMKQFERDDAVKSTIIITDKGVNKILYVITIPLEDPAPFNVEANKQLRQALKNTGLSDAEVDKRLAEYNTPAMQAATERMTAQLKTGARFVQVDSYSQADK